MRRRIEQFILTHRSSLIRATLVAIAITAMAEIVVTGAIIANGGGIKEILFGCCFG